MEKFFIFLIEVPLKYYAELFGWKLQGSLMQE